MLSAMLPATGKRGWQRVADAYEKELRECEQGEDEELVTDRTRLLASTHSPSACRTLADMNEMQRDGVHSQSYGYADQAAAEHGKPSKKGIKGVENPNIANRRGSVRMQNPAPSPLPLKKDCSHASWQGLKQILRKQFMPPFPFGKGLLPPEDMQRCLRHRRQMEGAATQRPVSDVLGSRMNNGIKKSAFITPASTNLGRSKENRPCNLPQPSSLGRATSSRSIKLNTHTKYFHDDVGVNANKSDANVTQVTQVKRVMPVCSIKENSILKKLKCRGKKENEMLLANVMES